MIQIKNEFSHVVKLDEIGQGASQHKISAGKNERNALAKRFDLIALDLLEADISLVRSDAFVRAKGLFRATVVQACIASGDPVVGNINEPVEIKFSREPDLDTDVEIELEEEDCDTMFHDGKAVDLGEAVAQSLGLALNPYPRSVDAEEKLRAAGVKSEGEAGPFGALAALRDKMTGQ